MHDATKRSEIETLLRARVAEIAEVCVRTAHRVWVETEARSSGVRECCIVCTECSQEFSEPACDHARTFNSVSEMAA